MPTMVKPPPSSMRSASSGKSSARAASAACACPRAFISSQWPSNMIVTRAESSHQNSRSNHPMRGGERCCVRDADRHRDQQHHSRLALLDLRPRARQKHPAAPEEDHGAEDRSDPVDAGEIEVVAEPVHDHRAGDDDRDGQQQAPPESSPKHVRMARMLRARVAVAAVLRRGFDLMRRVVGLALHVGHPCGLRVVEEQRTFAAQRTDL